MHAHGILWWNPTPLGCTATEIFKKPLLFPSTLLRHILKNLRHSRHNQQPNINCKAISEGLLQSLSRDIELGNIYSITISGMTHTPAVTWDKTHHSSPSPTQEMIWMITWQRISAALKKVANYPKRSAHILWLEGAGCRQLLQKSPVNSLLLCSSSISPAECLLHFLRRLERAEAIPTLYPKRLTYLEGEMQAGGIQPPGKPFPNTGSFLPIQMFRKLVWI